MAGVEIELRDTDFITIGTIGPKGKRAFYLQAGQNTQLVSLLIEKEQSWALSEAIKEMLEDLDERYDLDTDTQSVDLDATDMDLREPIEPVFRVSQIGLGYDEERNKIVLVAQELVMRETPPDIGDLGTNIDLNDDEESPSVVRIWCSPEQMNALSEQAFRTVKSGRADPKQNGRLVYYWT